MDKILGFIYTMIIVIIIFIINKRKKENIWRYNNNLMNNEEKERYELKLQKRKIKKEKREKSKISKKYFKAEKKKKLKDYLTISKVMIVASNQDIQKKFGSSVVRGAIGDFFLGPIGLVGGALSGKNEVSNTTTFLIEYADGHREIKTIDNDSNMFKKLCKYLEM